MPALIISGRARRAQALPVMLILQIMPRRQTPWTGTIARPDGISRTTYDPATRHATHGQRPFVAYQPFAAVIPGGAGVVPGGASAATGDGTEMHKHVRAALDRDEIITFAAVEPFHRALRHLDLLVVPAVPCHGRGRARHLGSASLSRNALERKPVAR